MDKFSEYLMQFLGEKELRQNLRIQEESRNDVAPCIGPQTGSLLAFLIRSLKAKNALELGACQGYSTIWLAEALQETGGQLTTIDISPRLLNETKENLQKVNLKNVSFISDDARNVLPKLKSASFDLILQDSAKALYEDMLNECVRLLRLGGILISDDILFKPLGKRASIAEAIHNYNHTIKNDARLFTTFLSVGDGVALSLKTKE